MLLSSIIFYPWLLYLYTLYGLDMRSDLALSGIVIYLCIWLNSLLICAICTSDLTSKWIQRVTYGTLVFGTLWVIMELGLQPTNLCIAALLIVLIFRLWQTPRSIFRWSVFALVTISLIITLIHHNTIINGLYKQDNLRIEAIVTAASRQTQLDWTNAPCVYQDWNLDQCLRFPAGYEDNAIKHPTIRLYVDNMRLNWKKEGVTQYGSTHLDSSIGRHWGISFDGKFWQIAYRENHYFQQIVEPLITFEWYFSVVIWGCIIFSILNWHTRRTTTQRYQQSTRVGLYYTGLLSIHCAQLWIVTHLLERYTPSNIAHPDRLALLINETQSFLFDLIIYSLAGWTTIALIIRFHIPVVRYMHAHFNTQTKVK